MKRGRCVHKYQKYLPIPPRKQWVSNYGYCGETALICAGLYYGQYVSQFKARDLASGPVKQSKEKSQLLLGPGTNCQRASIGMGLSFLDWEDEKHGKTAEDFLVWIKGQILNDCPLAIGVYMNQSIFGDGCDDEYDHIVPVIGIESNHPLSDMSYHPDDEIVFSDNGLYTPDDEPVPFIFKYDFSSFQRSRTDANRKSASIYSLPNDVSNVGIALTRNNSESSTRPVCIEAYPNEERPEIEDKTDKKPSRTPLELRISLSCLVPGVVYNLYRYSKLSKVPKKAFNKHASKASQVWKVVSTSMTMSLTDTIWSDEVAVYRAVEASAP